MFNNVPKLICDSIDEFFKPNIGILTKNPKKSYETFKEFYEGLNRRDRDNLKPIWEDYNYWKTDPIVGEKGERDKIVVTTNPGQIKNKAGEIVDENTPRWNEAQISVKKAIKMLLGNAIQLQPERERLDHHFKELKIKAAADKLLESYTDKGAEGQYTKQYGQTTEYKNVKDALLRQVRGLPSQVEKWAEGLKKYWENYK